MGAEVSLVTNLKDHRKITMITTYNHGPVSIRLFSCLIHKVASTHHAGLQDCCDTSTCKSSLPVAYFVSTNFFFVRPEWPCFPGHEDPEKKTWQIRLLDSVRSQIISDDQPHFTSRRRRDSVLSETELVHGSVGAPCKFKEMTSGEFDLSFLPACRA